ncbi:MAG: ribonuclease HI [Chloroflexota bacterium]
MPDKVIIYTDGGCKPNPGPGGWAALLMYGTHRKELSGGDRKTTNNKMELTAAIEALEALKTASDVELYTDSQYVKNGITSWMANWKRNGWKTASKKPVKNRDLWVRLDDATQRHNIEWKWVKGHSNNEHNERVDQLATQARENL